MKLLALDSATDLCSAALWVDGVVSARETLAPRQHGALLLMMVDTLLAEAGLELPALDAIAFGRGPGGFTGLRLAAATAQGLGFAGQRPLIPVSDLRALASQVLAWAPPRKSGRVLICQDARMQEVYWGCYERRAPGEPLRGVGEERVSAPAAVSLPAAWVGAGEVRAGGSGFAAYPELRAHGSEPFAVLLPDLYPRAREIAALAVEDGLAAAVSPEQALPVYLRDRVTTVAPHPP